MSSKIQTKRNLTNKHRWKKQVGYAVRMQNREKHFKTVIMSKCALDRLKF